MDKSIKLYGGIGETIKAFDFSNNLAELEQSGCKNLTIHLHSQGGDVFSGNIIFNAIKSSSINIKIVVDGIAASMAGILLLSANSVEISENGFVMVHRPYSGVNGNSDALLEGAKVLNDIENQFANCYAEKTGKNADEFKKMWLDGKDHWLNADEAVKYGFANKKIKPIAKDINKLDKSVISKMTIYEAYNSYNSILNNNEQENPIMKKELIEMFQLDGLTEQSSDTAVLQKMKEKFDDLQKQNEESKKQADEAVEDSVSNAVKNNLIPVNMTDTYKEIGKKNGLKVLNELIGSKQQTSIKILDFIKPESKGSLNPTNKSEWTLEDYRLNAPEELKNNPKLYDELYNRQYGNN